MIYDVAIVGAGAAGLACAERLQKAGLKIVVIEGRSRLGGRILSLPIPNTSLFAELGAEFIHGTPPELMALVRANAPVYDACDTHFEMRNSGLIAVDYWKTIEAISGRLRPRKDDRPLAEIFPRLTAHERDLFRSYVEGFHSADTEQMGQNEFLEEEQGEDKSLNGAALFRIPNGYSSLVLRPFEDSPHLRRAIRFETTLKRVSRKGALLGLDCRSRSGGSTRFRARRLVVTVPVGVLKAPARTLAGIEWDTQLGVFPQSFEALRMGCVERLVFHFRTRFWESLSSHAPIGFLHANARCEFPVWWTLMPMRAPVLVAWQGGPKAAAMASLAQAPKIELALKTLGGLVNKSPSFLRSQVLKCYAHTWGNDPYTLGAYSYVGVGGAPAARRLSSARFDPIYFAGEGTVMGSGRGTVHGALRSGYRVARQILAH